MIEAGKTYERGGQRLRVNSILRMSDQQQLSSWSSGQEMALVSYEIEGVGAGRKKASCVLHWTRDAKEVGTA